MNQITVVGRLGKAGEVRYTQSGTSICNFNVACDTGYGEHKKTTWFRCTIVGKRAESLSDYLVKGKEVTIIGEATLNEYTGKDGKHYASIEVFVKDIALHGKAELAHQEKHEESMMEQELPF